MSSLTLIKAVSVVCEALYVDWNFYAIPVVPTYWVVWLHTALPINLDRKNKLEMGL